MTTFLDPVGVTGRGLRSADVGSARPAGEPPAGRRWQPLRAGLISIWRYWDETFTFHQGRLLLRGPNGSGKSMALELLLPFLLDGDSSPARLTSSRHSRGRLFERLMTGTTDASRTGFAWVEFGRGAGDSDETFTVGARIRGSRSTDRVDVELFTTTLSVGRDLHLLDAARVPLSHQGLKAAIEGTGDIHRTAEEHRNAVRAVLFPGFSQQRYASVISALLALRKEKLSDNLDPEKLSAVLSDALPPLDENDIAAVAEGFERLDRRRGELTALSADLDEVRTLGARQRAYATVMLVASAAEVRAAESVRDDVTRAERLAREGLADADSRSTAVHDERDRHATRLDTIGVEESALKDSDAYRDGSGLAELRNQATRLRDTATRVDQAADRARRQADTRAAERDAAADAQRVAVDNETRAADDLHRAAEPIGGAAAVADALALPDAAAGGRLLQAWIDTHRDKVREVRKALAEHERAVDRRDQRAEQVDAAEESMAQRETDLREADATERSTRASYARSVSDWAAAAVTVGPDRLTALLPDPADDPPTVRGLVEQLRGDLATAHALELQRLHDRTSDVEAELDELRTERERWQSTELVPPPTPAWRSDRVDLPGAPLWRLVEPLPDVDDADLDRVEAALTAAGLVDAWVLPDGRIDLGPDRADLQLAARPADPAAAADVAPPAGHSLADLLAPGVGNTAVKADVVAAVLAAIPLLESVPTTSTTAADSGDRVAIGRDGSFRLGPAVGRAERIPATLLGASARERHRLARLAELDAAIDQATRRRDDLDRQAALARQRAAAAADEFAALPSGEPVVAAGQALDRAQTRLEEARSAVATARAAVRAAEEHVRAALRALTSLAATHGLPTGEAELEDRDRALSRLSEIGRAWTHRRGESSTAGRRVAEADVRAAEAASDAELAVADQQRSDREATEAEVRSQTMEESVGADFRNIVDRLAGLQRERDQVRARHRELAVEVEQLTLRIGELRTELRQVTARREDAEAGREDTHRRFVGCCTALAADAGIDPGDLGTATAVLAAARTIGAAKENVDASPEARERRSQSVDERVYAARSALGARVDFDRELTADGWWVLRVVTGGLRRSVGELTDQLAKQLADGKAELAEDEERLFEQTLAGSVRRALADRIRQGNALVDGINRQLGTVRTATAGVAVRLRWGVDPDQPAAVRAARALLLRDPADLDEGERASLQDFVRARVDQARADQDPGTPWEARLRDSLDYRAWHVFELQVAHRDWEGYQPATRKRLSRLSTGERSIALHLPMIASVAAHYTDDAGAPATCPRLILLDELFAGVDTANRAQLFGAFSRWSLDAVFTSDHEWCQYADLDGIAIHYLSPAAPDEPVTSTRFVWDGFSRQIDPTPG